jgi:hypothetical protein
LQQRLSTRYGHCGGRGSRPSSADSPGLARLAGADVPSRLGVCGRRRQRVPLQMA